MRRWLQAASLCWFAVNLVHADSAKTDSTPDHSTIRIEARSANLLAVGLLTGDRMNIHLSQLIDNAPVHDAALSVALRMLTLPATAETDGSYSVRSTEFNAPGRAVIAFNVVRGGATEKLVGTLEGIATSKPAATNTARQMWWWVLNFGVCIGFLVLFSRRQKTRAAAEE